MKDLSVTEVFCEVFSGLLLILFALPWLSDQPFLSLLEFYRSAYATVTGTNIAVILICAYLLGLLIDGIGLLADKYIFDHVITWSPPTTEESRQFYQDTSEHVLNYRDTQWAYYSLYRNVFLIVAAGAVSTLILVFNLWLWPQIIAFIVFIVVLEYGLFSVMQSLASLYHSITKSFHQSGNGPPETEEE